MSGKTIVMEKMFNRQCHINDRLDELNMSLDVGDSFVCEAKTSEQEMDEIKSRAFPINYISLFFYYFWHRACAKARGIRNIYFRITGGTKRAYTKTEILGRIIRAGFEIEDIEERDGIMRVRAVKVSDPLPRDHSRVSFILSLPRRGLGGKMIKVYKFRTMHSYAEYVQGYLYKQNNLSEGGKFSNDFRISGVGKILRPFWLDELPMIVNLIKGDIKLVGVRPLSEQYFSLYSEQMQELRKKVKPGLLPPFYYEKQSPKTIEEVQESERRYIEAYLSHPLRTDFRYFFGTIWNIVSNRKTSK